MTEFVRVLCRWSGRCVWGVSYNGLNVHSTSCSLPDATPNHSPTNRSVVLSTSEDAQILRQLSRKFAVEYAAGAGYKILCTADDLVSSYVLSSANTFKWDTCAPHVILLAKGGGIVDLKQAVDSVARGRSTSDVADECQLRYHQANDGYSCDAVERWSNDGGVIAYCSTDVLSDVLAALVVSDWYLVSSVVNVECFRMQMRCKALALKGLCCEKDGGYIVVANAL